MKTQFWMVNAFTTERFKGNPAGVFIVDEFPKKELMQAIAAELNWSQTAFVKMLSNDRDGSLGKSTTSHAHIRWFSPRDETQICGHATLASAHTLWAEGYVNTPTILFESLAGPLFVTRNTDETITMDFPQKPIAPCPCPTALQQALVQTDGTPVAIESVYRDDAIFVVVLQNPADLLNLKPNLALIEQLDCRAVSVTSEGLNGHDFQSRYFAPRVGINEDPVCGSSHARLGLLWQDRLGKSHLRAYQASARSGTLSVDVTEDRILLTSHAVTVFNGEMDLGAQVCVANSAEQSADEAKSTRRAA